MTDAAAQGKPCVGRSENQGAPGSNQRAGCGRDIGGDSSAGAHNLGENDRRGWVPQNFFDPVDNFAERFESSRLEVDI